MLTLTAAGLYCPAGGFHVDPWGPVERAVLTHAHADHARPGSARYLATTPSLPVLRRRLPGAVLAGVAYGETVRIGDVAVSLHPAGHVLGSAQVRIEHGGEVWVVSGDYKRAPDPTCRPLEPLRCHTFVTEATFGLPIYRWPDPADVGDAVVAWWDACAAAGKPAVLGVYAFGKAQRVLAMVAERTDRPVAVHGAVQTLVDAYREAGVVDLARTEPVTGSSRTDWAGALVLATPAAIGSPWMKRLKEAEIALASGWMAVRGNQRWKAYDRGFALSDHADWPALLDTVDATGADRVLVTHGYSAELARYLRETRPIDADVLETRFAGEAEA